MQRQSESESEQSSGGATITVVLPLHLMQSKLGWRIPLCDCTLGLYELAARKKRMVNKVSEGENWILKVARMSAHVHLGDIFWSVECA